MSDVEHKPESAEKTRKRGTKNEQEVKQVAKSSLTWPGLHLRHQNTHIILARAISIFTQEGWYLQGTRKTKCTE